MKKSEAIALLALLVLAGFTGTTVCAQNIFVSNQGTPGSISEFDANGNLINVLVSGLDDPTGLAFDKSGNLYVANYYGGTVSEYDSAGDLINGSFASGLVDAEGLAFDSSGNLFVTSLYNGGTVSEFNSNGKLVKSFASGSPAVNRFPAGLAFDSTGNLYVANQFGGKIAEFDAGGVMINNSFVTSPGAFGLAFGKNGNLYVANYTGTLSNYVGTVSEFAPDGHLINPSFASGLDGASGLVFDNNGNLFVANRNDNNILEFDQNGNLINTISSPSLNAPMFLAIQPVPEPATWALLGIGVAAFVGLGARRWLMANSKRTRSKVSSLL
jgi:sugar lactone lactonase YvrE